MGFCAWRGLGAVGLLRGHRIAKTLIPPNSHPHTTAMKKFLTILTAFTLTTIAAQSQSIIANWTFEPDPLAVNVTNSAIGPFSPAVGSGSVTGLHASNNTAWSSPGGNGSSNSLSANNWTTGDYFQFQFSTLTFSNIGMTWSQTRSSTGPTIFSLSYSTDGTAFTTFTNYSVAQVTWSSSSNNIASVFTADFATTTLINNQANVYFRLVSGQTASGAGTGRVDDITLTGVPEPSTYAMLALAGAGFAGYVIRRRRR
jgi:hypothetical protein